VDDKRERILTAARKRFRYFGVKKTTMQEIAGDAGVAVGTLYLYFKNKDELLVACTEEYIARHHREADAILASDVSAGEKLRRYALNRFRAAEATRTGYRQAAELTREVLRVRPERRLDEGRMMTESFARFLRLGIEASELFTEDPEGDARVLLFSLAFFFPGPQQELPYPPKEEDLLMVVDWFLGVWQRQAEGRAGASRRR
jgi:AcrR family transcriptional regulator